ncbi:MAG: class I SAM-dependent DNA methyltransferase [Desulfuromonadales bacterium]|nr:MAG: class I SAM-dependent DNA methyltransferase [Desulfuromonadales bacterium]
MPEAPATSAAVADFLRRWEASGAAERANYQLFLSELCDLLEVPRPEPTQPDDRNNAYVFERAVTFRHGTGLTSTGRIDLYKRDCFVLEAKQGSDRPGENQPLLVREEETPWLSGRRGTAVRGTRGWDVAMLKAKGQAEQYARALPVEEGWPPFLVVVDVGHAIELYSEFSRTGKAYLPFPDPSSYRILLADLEAPEIRERLRLVWNEPHRLDPARQSARATREVADRLALLAKSLEQAGHQPEKVGNFLKRCLFTMFAEDVGLIPNASFTGLLESLKGEADKFAPMAESLWITMKDGGFSPVLREKLLRFNGGLFEEAEALPIGEEQLSLLIRAGKADWRDVEPAIFGTLLERALDPEERHHLGAHYTPREYVERLVLPTVVEPLRSDWEAVLAAAVTLDRQGDQAGAASLVKEFHRALCALRILDPACGSGNFLYVTFEHLKRLEGEVLNALAGFGESQALLDLAGTTVDPHQLLGIEVNPRAAAITDMVLWIGYLQWHFRTRGHVLPPEPVIRKFRNIECRDAVLAYDGVEPVVDQQGEPVTRWDGRTTRAHPVTGEQVPDETARVPVVRYLNPRQAQWPEADFVVGNPPFLGAATMRRSLGDGYVEALRAGWKEVPDSADFVMYWWQQAAGLTRQGKLRRFGFITTNSIRQSFNRRVIEQHLAGAPPLSLAFAIPDHPWVDSTDGAAVRIAMTVGRPATEGSEGKLVTVTAEREGDGEGIGVELAVRHGVLHADLTVGANVAGTKQLYANSCIAIKGFELGSQGFLVTKPEALELLNEDASFSSILRPYMNGSDLVKGRYERYVVDFYGKSIDEARKYPRLFQHVIDHVLPERSVNREERTATNWWLFRRSGEALRSAVHGLERIIATTRTAKFRIFQFLPSEMVAESKIVVIASDNAYVLGALSSRIHVVWSLATGGWLGVGNDPTYNHTDCFNKFPFPDCDGTTKERIRALAEQLDLHRKRQQALHPDLTLTGMYNVLEKLREIDACRGGIHDALDVDATSQGAMNRAPTLTLTAKEKTIHEQGLVAVLRQLHDELDAAVAEAYGWPADLSDEEILERLVALNRKRAREEEQGLVRWLRPEYQRQQGEEVPPHPAFGHPLPGGEGLQISLSLGERAGVRGKGEKLPWPKTLPEQVQAVRAALAATGGPVTAEALARTFQRARTDKVAELLATLAAIGQAREVEPRTYSG